MEKTTEKVIGWLEEYSIVCSSQEEADKVYEWIESGRGINCWITQEITPYPRRMFTPGDRNDKPHWSMGLIETVPTIKCSKRIKIFYEKEHAIPSDPPKERKRSIAQHKKNGHYLVKDGNSYIYAVEDIPYKREEE